MSGSHCPLDPFSGPVEPSLSSRPLLRPIRLSLPRGPHLRCCPSFSIPVGPTSGPVRPSLSPSAPAGPPNSPSRALHPLQPRSAAASPPPGHQPPWSSSPTLPSSSFPHRRPDTHYSLSSTMSLRGSAAARFPPASRRPLSPWPGPARRPVRLRRGLLCPRRSRCGRRAGSCAPASPPPALLPTPPRAPVPQRRAGAGRLCGNQSVTRSGAR